MTSIELHWKGMESRIITKTVAFHSGYNKSNHFRNLQEKSEDHKRVIVNRRRPDNNNIGQNKKEKR